MAGQPGYEADDVIGTLAARSPDPVDVVTGDRDLFQLVDDARRLRIIYTVRGLLNLDVIDEAAVTAKYGIPGRAYADFAALRGDPSDGLPGVPGVGEKTAAALIRAFGSIDGHHALRWTRARRLPAGQPGEAGRKPGTTWTSPCPSSGSPTTSRCRRWTGTLPRAARTPFG